VPTTPRDSAQANSYRKAAERIEDVETLPVGPAKQCPACGATASNMYRERINLTHPRACITAKRINEIPYSFSFNPFASKCTVDGSHLHERCEKCGHQWLTAFVGDK